VTPVQSAGKENDCCSSLAAGIRGGVLPQRSPAIMLTVLPSVAAAFCWDSALSCSFRRSFSLRIFSIAWRCRLMMFCSEAGLRGALRSRRGARETEHNKQRPCRLSASGEWESGRKCRPETPRCTSDGLFPSSYSCAEGPRAPARGCRLPPWCRALRVVAPSKAALVHCAPAPPAGVSAAWRQEPACQPRRPFASAFLRAAVAKGASRAPTEPPKRPA